MATSSSAPSPAATFRSSSPPSPPKIMPRRQTTGRPRIQSDVFRPNLPRDPFAALPKPPILVSLESVFTLAASTPAINVILALGEPSQEHLAPLIYSEQLSASLLIVASHDPPDIPHDAFPAVRVLRLAVPLDLEHAGAVRLVNVLEWAERVARAWRKHGGSGVLHIDETDTGVLAPPPALRSRANSASSMRSAASSTMMSGAGSRSGSAPLSPTSQPSSPRASHLSLSASASTSNLLGPRTTLRSRRPSRGLPKADPRQRPFDALVHCLGARTPEKQLLKQAILVTTVSRPFLVPAAPPTPTLPSRASTAPGAFPRRSFLRESVASLYSTPPSSRDSLAGTPPPMPASTRAHLLHVLPARANASARVLSSIEAFLLSFSSTTSTSSSPSAPPFPSAAMTPGPALPLVLDARTLAAPLPLPPVGIPPGFSVADALLGGCMDAALLADPRAWLARAADVSIVADASTQPHPDSHFVADPHNAAKSLRVRGAGMLPTPPDSEEDTSEKGAEEEKLTGAELEKMPGCTLSAPPTLLGRQSTFAPSVRSEREREREGKRRRAWMFWRR